MTETKTMEKILVSSLCLVCASCSPTANFILIDNETHQRLTVPSVSVETSYESLLFSTSDLATATAQPDGSFHIDNLSPNSNTEIYIAKPGYSAASIRWSPGHDCFSIITPYFPSLDGFYHGGPPQTAKDDQPFTVTLERKK